MSSPASVDSIDSELSDVSPSSFIAVVVVCFLFVLYK
jgi:hypothetical protein